MRTNNLKFSKQKPFKTGLFILLLIFLMTSLSKSFAQNPILPPGIFMADPSAHTWNDSIIYIYGSVDEDRDYWCSTDYKMSYSTDMKTWSVPQVFFSSKGENNGIPYSDEAMGAPDVQFRNGKYYVYYCQDGVNAEGVAQSDSPFGPFMYGQKLYLANINQIDPALFIDDDGQAYYLWGQFNGKIARMKPNMTEIDTTTIIEGIVTEEEHFFHEGLFMAKRNGMYYIMYADISRGGKPTCIGYSYSRSPMGPYTYGGVIIDNKLCDPMIWNNHGSIAEFQGQWYVFYQRASNGSASLRKTCIEPISFREDGTIPEVEMTSQGAGDPLNALNIIDAALACNVLGGVRISTISPTNEILSNIANGTQAVYKYLDFKDGVDHISIKVAPGEKPARIKLSFGPWVNVVGYVDVPAKGKEEWITIDTEISEIKGIHALWLSFSDDSDQFQIINFTSDKKDSATGKAELMKVDEFRFY